MLVVLCLCRGLWVVILVPHLVATIISPTGPLLAITGPVAVVTRLLAVLAVGVVQLLVVAVAAVYRRTIGLVARVVATTHTGRRAPVVKAEKEKYLDLFAV